MKAVAAVLGFGQPHLIWNTHTQLKGQFVLVDNGSQPPLSHSGRIIRHDKNTYFTGGWNKAMRQFHHEGYRWVWMLNSDLEGLYPEMLGELVQIAESMGPSCAAISATYNSPHAFMNAQSGPSPREVRWLDWAGPLVNTEWFSGAGGFDEQFFGYGADIDLCKTLTPLGAKFYVVDWLLFHHLGSITAIAEGISKHMDVGHMNRVLHQKWGVRGWSEMF